MYFLSFQLKTPKHSEAYSEPFQTSKKTLFAKTVSGWKVFFNSFVSNAPFLYPLKTSETVISFQGVEKGCIGNEWVKTKSFRKTLLLRCLTGFWICHLHFTCTCTHEFINHISRMEICSIFHSDVRNEYRVFWPCVTLTPCHANVFRGIGKE